MALLDLIKKEIEPQNVILFSVIFIAFFTIRAFAVRQRLPKVPYLTISSLPGAAGAAADIRSFVTNGSTVMQAGYDKVRQNAEPPRKLNLLTLPLL
jgi:hypothetical protein